MSIVEVNKIDAMGISEDGETLVILLSDHLSWRKEHKHLVMLQDKINAYVSFWEEKQYKSIYHREFQFAIIEIHFKYAYTEKCEQFLNAVANQLTGIGIAIQVQIGDNYD